MIYYINQMITISGVIRAFWEINKCNKFTKNKYTVRLKVWITIKNAFNFALNVKNKMFQHKFNEYKSETSGENAFNSHFSNLIQMFSIN